MHYPHKFQILWPFSVYLCLYSGAYEPLKEHKIPFHDNLKYISTFEILIGIISGLTYFEFVYECTCPMLLQGPLNEGALIVMYRIYLYKSRAHIHAWAQIQAGYCSRINEINAWVCLNAGCHMQLFNSINSNGVIRQENKCILAIYVDKYIFLSEVVIIDNLQSIRDICCLLALICLRFRQ